MSKVALLAVAVLCASLPSFAAEDVKTGVVSAADLDNACTARADNTCSDYIDGFVAGFYYATVEARAGFPACVPKAVAGDQARFIVTRFLRQHPEMAQQGAPSVVTEALLAAFPCAGEK